MRVLRCKPSTCVYDLRGYLALKHDLSRNSLHTELIVCGMHLVSRTEPRREISLSIHTMEAS